jgi:hypothetical protein
MPWRFVPAEPKNVPRRNKNLFRGLHVGTRERSAKEQEFVPRFVRCGTKERTANQQDLFRRHDITFYNPTNGQTHVSDSLVKGAEVRARRSGADDVANPASNSASGSVLHPA